METKQSIGMNSCCTKQGQFLSNSPAQYINLQLLLSADKGAHYVAQYAGAPAGELGSQNGGDDRKSDILP